MPKIVKNTKVCFADYIPSTNILTTTVKTEITSTMTIQFLVGLNGDIHAIMPMGDFATSTVPNDAAGGIY
jgi:hypothetical protein